MAAAVLAAAAFVSCAEANPLQREVEKSNSRLPEDMGYGMTLESIAYADSTVSACVNVGESEVQLSTIRAHSGAITHKFAEYMRQQPDSTDVGTIIRLIKDQGASLRMLFCTDTDTVSILIPSEEL